MEQAEHVEEDVGLVGQPEKVERFLPDQGVGEHKYQADDGVQGHARQARQRLEQPVLDARPAK